MDERDVRSLERINNRGHHAKDRRKDRWTKESRKGTRDRSHAWVEVGRVEARTGHARTHANLSAASRCYRGTTLMSCILSILLRAPRQCIWPIVHLSIHVALRSLPLASPRAPIILPFTSLVNRPNNQMKPLAYCRLLRHRGRSIHRNSYFSIDLSILFELRTI